MPVHRQAYILERGLHADLPVTDTAAATTLALPIYAGLTQDEQRTVIDVVRRAVLDHSGVAATDLPRAVAGGIDRRPAGRPGAAPEAAAR